MNKTLLNLLLVSVLVFCGCGGNGGDDGGGDNKSSSSSKDDSSSSSKDKSPPSSNDTVSAASRDAFIGTWKGKYEGLDDEMIIEKGASDLEVVITIHSTFGDNPDKVNGKLVANDRIEVPEQTMGGAAGTAVITLVDGKLQLEQSGLGMTGKGKDYEKQ